MHANTVWMHVFITSIKDLQLALSLSLISIAVFLHASFRTQTIPCLRNHLVIDCCVCMDVRTYVRGDGRIVSVYLLRCYYRAT